MVAGPTDPETKRQIKRWLEGWKHVGPLLEQERWARLAAMADDEVRRDAIRLWQLWRPDWPTDDGEELLLHQQVFARARRPA
jgi:hypothetical protein